MATLGENLKKIRGKRDQGPIAAAMGVNQTQLSNWENDRHVNVTVKTLLALAKGYGCRVEALIAGLDEEYDGRWSGDDQQPKLTATPTAPTQIASEEINDLLLAADDEEREFATGVLRRLLRGRRSTSGRSTVPRQEKRTARRSR